MYVSKTPAAYLLVVIQDDNHVFIQESRMIHGLVRHASSDCTISNHSYAVIFPILHNRMTIES